MPCINNRNSTDYQLPVIDFEKYNKRVLARPLDEGFDIRRIMIEQWNYSVGKEFRNFSQKPLKQTSIVLCHIFIAETLKELVIFFLDSLNMYQTESSILIFRVVAFAFNSLKLPGFDRETFCLITVHKFSIGFKSVEFPGHCSTLAFSS